VNCGAGVSPAIFLTSVHLKTAGETQAPHNTSAMRNQGWANILQMPNAYMAETHPCGSIPNDFVTRYTSP
jgi:hypothetical protein